MAQWQRRQSAESAQRAWMVVMLPPAGTEIVVCAGPVLVGPVAGPATRTGPPRWKARRPANRRRKPAGCSTPATPTSRTIFGPCSAGGRTPFSEATP